MSKKPQIIPPDVYTRFLTYWQSAQLSATEMRKGILPLGLVAAAYKHMTPYALASAYKPNIEPEKPDAEMEEVFSRLD